ncbi:hypothetical protein M2271_006875 [Streptomyces sp. LBL]|uniref:hypothetical protein n=1 Tax=Streptomyces sp. LBL TaxID=2940562 RepID=UPI00247434CE|nr:hypothetical protein [Streptomyces sp. LBL]MDH6629040.1 hypothetical protein [Streptomyces sp. LBL]
MSTETLTSAAEAFISLVDHCTKCPDCRATPALPDKTPECPEAESLYRAWFTLWRKEMKS